MIFKLDTGADGTIVGDREEPWINRMKSDDTNLILHGPVRNISNL